MHNVEVTPSPSRRVMSAPVPGWTGRLWQSCHVYHQSTRDGGTVLWRQKDRTRITVPCPLSIIDYSQFMGGVDRGDQVRGYYSCRTKCRKFYKYIFYFLFDVAIMNAYILQKGYCGSVPFSTIKAFRLQLATELTGDYCSRRRVGRGSVSVTRTLPLRHYPTTIPEEDPNKKAKHKRANVTGATVGAKGAPTLPGTATSVSYGCAIQESGTQIVLCCGMLNTCQNKISSKLLKLLLILSVCHPISRLLSWIYYPVVGSRAYCSTKLWLSTSYGLIRSLPTLWIYACNAYLKQRWPIFSPEMAITIKFGTNEESIDRSL